MLLSLRAFLGANIWEQMEYKLPVLTNLAQVTLAENPKSSGTHLPITEL